MANFPNWIIKNVLKFPQFLKISLESPRSVFNSNNSYLFEILLAIFPFSLALLLSHNCFGESLKWFEIVHICGICLVFLEGVIG